MKIHSTRRFLLCNLKEIIAGCSYANGRQESARMKFRTEVVIALVIPSIVIIVAALNYFGFCIRKGGFLSDEDALRAALRHQAPLIDGLAASPTSGELDQYRAAHPNCCIVIGEPNILNDTFVDYITGFRKRWVQIVYKGSSTSPGYRDAIVAVVPCGQAVYGSAMPISENEMKLRLEEIGRKTGSAK